MDKLLLKKELEKGVQFYMVSILACNRLVESMQFVP